MDRLHLALLTVLVYPRARPHAGGATGQQVAAIYGKSPRCLPLLSRASLARCSVDHGQREDDP